MTDPIADMLARIRNAVTAKHTRVDMPASRLKAEIARILQDEGYIQGFKLLDDAALPTKTLRLFLKYGPHGEKLITGVERISRPGRRVYFGRDDGAVEVQGPKGKMRQAFPSGINFELADGHLVAKTVSAEPELGKFHGLARSLVANAVAGVTNGYKKELDIVGVGYRAEVKGKQVIFALGYSHPLVFDIPQGIDIAIDKQTHIT